MKFKYEGFNVGGQVTSGEVEASSREEAAEKLRDDGLYVQQLKEVGVEEFKPVLPQKQKADEFTEGLGFKKKIEPLRKPEEPKQEKWLAEKDAEKTPQIVKEVAQQVKLEDTQEVKEEQKEEQKEEDTKKEACTSCPSGCHCEKHEDRNVDEKLMMDIMHLMSAGTDTQMLMKSMYKDNTDMYEIMKGLIQNGMGHALGQLLVESVARRR